VRSDIVYLSDLGKMKVEAALRRKTAKKEAATAKQPEQK
jgi:hypothetical protein